MIKSLSDNYWQNCLHEGSNQLFQCDTGKRQSKSTCSINVEEVWIVKCAWVNSN